MTPTTLPSTVIQPTISGEMSTYQVDPLINPGELFRGLGAYVSQNAVESHQYVNMPIQLNATFYLPAALEVIRADVRETVVILHRHDEVLNRHEELLEEMRELIKVIEVETRRLNPDVLNDITDSVESELNDILHTIKERRYPSPPSRQMDALLERAIERKISLTQPVTSPAGAEESPTR